jgi:hypothetical protein
MELLVILLVIVVIAAPILAILAFSRVQQLSEQVRALRPQDLVARLYAVEQRLSMLEKRALAKSEVET